MKVWLAFTALLMTSACSQVADKADEVTSAAKSVARSAATSATNPWLAGCAAVDVGLRVNHLDRSAEFRILDGIAESPVLSDDLRSWLKLARKALTYTDPIALDSGDRAALNKPCIEHGHPIRVLGGSSPSPSPS